MNQNIVLWLLSGGFLKGYRTYVLTGIAVVTALGAYADGDMNLVQTITAVAGALGLTTAAQH